MDHHKEAQDERYLPQGYDIDKLEIVKRRNQSILHEVGTLGGGNHFIELQKDEEGSLWIMIHSGSRNLGKQVGDYYNKIAAHLNEIWHSSVSPDIRLPFLARGIVHAIRSQEDMQEASGAYKDIEEVIANELDLVKVKTRLLPVAVIKG